MMVISTVIITGMFMYHYPQWKEELFIPFGISINILIVVFIFVIMSINTTKDLINTAKEEAARNKDQYMKLENILSELQKGKNIGNDIISFNNKTIDVINNLKDKFEEIQNQSIELNQKLKTIVKSNEEVLTSTVHGRNEIDNQNAAIHESTATIEEITRVIQNITDTSRKKNHAIKELENIANSVDEKITTANESIITVKQSTSDILDINDMIQNISQQTNILSMNAAIEAAHAGETGRGFAVVADEIRKLSENTNQNSKNIKLTVTKIIKDIEESSKENEEASELFTRIRKEIRTFVTALQEITNGMIELSTGNDQILKAIIDLKDIAGKTSQSISSLEEMIRESNRIIVNIENFSEQIKVSMDNSVSEFSKIIQNIKNLDSIGQENLDQFLLIDEKIKKIDDE
jgi:methyl-accepting chemotaxis protein